jgi:subtilisin family serine protease
MRYFLPPVFRGPSADVLPLAGEANWGMAVFGIEKLRSITDGAGIKVGVCDTGVDNQHPDIAPNFAGGKDFTGSPIGYRDRNQHGTHTSGTVFARNASIGVASGARGYHAKGLGDDGSGSDTDLIAGMVWLADQGCEVISCSWGGGSPDPSMLDVLKELADAGIWPIFAAGNSGTGGIGQPAQSLSCIDVAALNRDLSPASFSSQGSKLDTSGPGVDIWSAKPGGGYQQMSGTSMAAPFVAGTLALYRAALKAANMPIPHVVDLRKLLFSRSTDTGTPGVDNKTGPGWITPVLLALNLTPDPFPLG